MTVFDVPYSSMAAETVEADQLRTGERREWAIFGTMAFCRKIGMAIGAFIASLVLAYFCFESGEVALADQPAGAITGIRIAYSLLPFDHSALQFVRARILSH